ncbi:tRNA (adenosine(37)-N6)-dimethylallyltransferase MiaA [Patescibacteria group bacterium]
MNLLKELKKFIHTNERPLIVVMGATAAGKTKISLTIAKSINGEIISTDSRQIYKQMDIGTDAISEKDQEGIPHHMLGIADPNEIITLAEFVDQSLKIIDNIYKRKKIPMLVGGTGLYIDAIIKNYQIPRIPPNPKLRQELEELNKNKGVEALYSKLKDLDTEAAKRIHPNNIRYVIRAIEVASSNQSSPQPTTKSPQTFQPFLIGINRPREEIYQKIEIRVDQQLKRGLVEEVQKLLEKGYSSDLPSMTSLGVKEIIPFIKGEMTLEECSDILKRNTRRYAKRQMTWLRRYDSVKWLTPSDIEKIVNSSQ